VFFSEDKGKDNADEDDTNENDSEEENPSSEEDSEDEEEEEESIPVRRKSSRSTAFRGGMKDPSNSIADLLKNDGQYSPLQAKKSRRAARHKKRSSLEASVESDNDDDDDDDSSVDVPRKKRSSKSVIKSPAKRHTKRRMTKKLEYAESESSEESDSEIDDDDDDEEEEEGEEMKFNKIIAAQSMTLGEWEKKCSKINTTEITNGSRWIQEKTDRDPDKYEERFLVKWEGLSFLHCSWETEKDLIEFCEQAKTKMSTFFRKAENGLLYDADERLDGVSTFDLYKIL
jgi:chromodomain-helicase-DNA-binding protein 1